MHNRKLQQRTASDSSTYIPTIVYLPSPSSSETFVGDADFDSLSCSAEMAPSKSSCDGKKY